MSEEFTYRYPMPAVTADIVVFNEQDEVLLIQRGNEPFKGCWALPGGHLEPYEDPYHAAARELREETGLDLKPNQFELVEVYGRGKRDPRGWYIGLLFFAQVRNKQIKAGDDAAAAQWVTLDLDEGLDSLRTLEKMKLAFDHMAMIQRAFRVEMDRRS